MQSFILFTLLGTSIAASLPSNFQFAKRQCSEPSQSDVVTAINRWNNDVGNVNSFLNLAPSQNPEDLLNAAEEALLNAQDEPTELGVLSCITGLADDATNAIANLQQVFGQVPSSIQNIINNPGDATVVASNLQTINNVRCCNVLPDLDVLWTAAADDEGVSNQVNLSVPRPNACASISC